ncbi:MULTISPECIES: hypothetical protein [unclassified Streptomyces]|uniref:hypothetical protein n=1 Tax=unclassified Streptomyces TaxID=2593676 RepID=UPI003806C6FC
MTATLPRHRGPDRPTATSPPATSPPGTAGRHTFGTGALSRAAALVHTLLTVELMVLATASPGLAALLLLPRSASNLPLAAVCLLPLGPALSAALYALHHRGRDLTELRPARAYLRGWRLNAGPVLALWAPLLGWLSVIGFSLVHFPASGLPRWWAWLLALTGLVSVLWGTYALVLTSLFTFRAADTARLAAYLLLRHATATLGTASLLVLAGGLTVLCTEALPALLAAPLLLCLLHTIRPVTTEAQEEFTV